MTTSQDSPDHPPPPRSESNWTAGRVVGMVFSSIAALIGIGLLLGGLALIAVHGFARDDEGFYTSDTEPLRSAAYAITTDEISLDADIADDVPEDLLGTLRIRAEAATARPIFLGIGRSADVERYLARVARSQLTDFRRGEAVFDQIPGRAPRGRPGAEAFWVAQSEGAGRREVEWDPEAGVWTVAVLNADGRRGVAVEADIGAKVGWLIWVGVGLTIVGLLVTATAIALVVMVSRRASRDQDD